jgi:hypothetical protein
MMMIRRPNTLLVCVQAMHEKPTLVAHWLACAGSVKTMMMMMMMMMILDLDDKS